MKNLFFPVRTAVTMLSLATVGALSAIAWSASAAQQAAQPPFIPLGMSINQLMVAVVDDAAHGIWTGGNKKAPLTKDEWENIRMNTFQLQATATLVSLGGTGAADRGWVTSPGFQGWARKLSDAAVSARDAVTAKNQASLRTAGDKLVEVCNDCHMQFKPAVPTEGILLKRGHPGEAY